MHGTGNQGLSRRSCRRQPRATPRVGGAPDTYGHSCKWCWSGELSGCTPDIVGQGWAQTWIAMGAFCPTYCTGPNRGQG
eukprot:11715778-Karenia_brevis.AAC.1